MTHAVAGPFSSNSAEAIDGVEGMSILRMLVTVLAAVLAIPLPLFLTAFKRHMAATIILG